MHVYDNCKAEMLYLTDCDISVSLTDLLESGAIYS